MASMLRKLWHYDVARIVEWHDGDTVKVQIDHGHSVFTEHWYRLEGVDTPELHTPEGKEVLQEVLKNWPAGTAVIVTTTKAPWRDDKKGKYGRYLARLTPADGVSINDWLLRRGLAKPYGGGKR